MCLKLLKYSFMNFLDDMNYGSKVDQTVFMVAPCTNNIKYFIAQLSHSIV